MPKTKKRQRRPKVGSSGCSVLSDRQILNWLSGKLNRRKGAAFKLFFQDSRDMGYKKHRISVFGPESPNGVFDKGNTVRQALSEMIRRERSQNASSQASKPAPDGSR